MPDTRKHRGPHPADKGLFAADSIPVLQSAVADLSWLQSRGYAEASSLKLVGDRYQLAARQRLAVARSACSDRQKGHRTSHHAGPDEMRGHPLVMDGFNVLTTIEVALCGGVILDARDGCFRDIAGMHGHYLVLEETPAAITLLKAVLDQLRPGSVVCLLDQPVSNSGRLAQILRDEFATLPMPVKVRLSPDPDTMLMLPDEPLAMIATADSRILDHCGPWVNLARMVLERFVPGAWVVPMSDDADS